MSNKVVPQVYRTIIDKVINSVRPDFEENGIEEAVLVALQQSWEARLAASRVADFSADARLGAYQSMLPQLPDKQLSGSGSDGQQQQQPQAATASTSAANPSNTLGSQIKSEKEATSAGNGAAGNGQSGKSKPALNPDSNELNSDLDESDDDLLSDDENGEEQDGLNALNGVGEGDVIVAVYEKVQRVKNKWKITLKDGVISADGKDYLFGKCQGDFEW